MSETCGVDYWLPDLMPRLPGATEELVIHETFAALREFCEEGKAWIDTLTDISSKANNRNIYLDPLDGGNKVGYVLGVQYDPNNDDNSRPLTAMTQWPARADTTSNDPQGYYMVDSGHMMLNPIPSVAHSKSYTVTLTLVPCSLQVRLPIEFTSHWRDSIITGVCSRMMAMSSKPWTDKASALFHGRRFSNYKKRARHIAESRFSRGDRAWQFPQGFASGSQRIRW